MTPPVMPLPPDGTRWMASTTGDGWVILRLAPANWTDERILKAPPAVPGDRWPGVLVGLCGADTRGVLDMAHGLLARYRGRYPEQASGADLVAAINHGQALPTLIYPAPAPAPLRAPVVYPKFKAGQWARLGKNGKPRQVLSSTDVNGFVETVDLSGRKRRAYTPQLVRIPPRQARNIAASVRYDQG